MELNQEQIIKALECCQNNEKENTCQYCKFCPASDADFDEDICDCYDGMMDDALSLIKELTEEIKKWEQAYDCADSARREFSSKCDELAEENERLIEELAKSCKALDESMNFYCSFTQSKVSNCPMDDEVVKAKADTVRKMQSEIEARCIKGGIYPAFVKRTIDQIAKEMLGE